ncbi:Alpha/Beta hydrolase protein, partial [Mycena olivaceomarginata]
ALDFGMAWTPEYDGASLASNQDIIVVSFNYRTNHYVPLSASLMNVFGISESPDLPLIGSDLGYLDHELAFQWVQSNIAKFGGDPKQVRILGQSAGAASVAAAHVRYTSANEPFRSAILLSGLGSSRVKISHPVLHQFQRLCRCSWLQPLPTNHQVPHD